MLVVISDLHLTDKTSGETINGRAFKIFKQDLADAVKNACFRNDEGESERFDAIERCDVILNGDILDVIRSEKWREQCCVKPWMAFDNDFYTTVEAVTHEIIDQNQEALGYLKSVAEGFDVTSPSGDTHHIPVHIHYMVGNHDWFFHLKHERIQALRSRLCDEMGLCNDPNLIFPHRLEEAFDDSTGTTLNQLCLEHAVYVQHGDIYDPINYDENKGRDYSSLGDAIVVMLLNCFPLALKRRLELSDTDPLYLQLKEIDNVRPLSEVPSWVYGVLRRHASDDQQDVAVDVWNECLAAFLEEDFVKSYDKPWRPDVVDALQAGFFLVKHVPLKALVKVTDRLMPFFASRDKYLDAAVKEPWLQSQKGEPARARYVTYGHTHEELLYPIDERSGPKGTIEDTIYFNSGTWRRVHRRCQLKPHQHEYTKFHVMTYLVFYKDDERNGRPYESWTGQLGSF